jgi:hypothetical protein
MEISISELGILRFLPFLLLGIIYSLPGESRRGWLRPSQAAIYCGVSLKVFRRWLKSGGLRHSVLPSNRILIKISWIDTFLEQFEVKSDVDRLVDEILKE